jgi:hypothetical protein
MKKKKKPAPKGNNLRRILGLFPATIIVHIFYSIPPIPDIRIW